MCTKNSLQTVDYKKRLENEHGNTSLPPKDVKLSLLTNSLEFGNTIAQQKWENISELVNFSTIYYTIESFLMDTQLTSTSVGKVIADGKVSILTMHSAKGFIMWYLFHQL
jgi:superfamily I DNA/RNA helicase